MDLHQNNETQNYWDPGGAVHNFKHNSRLGETIHVGNSDKFLSCAPRWSNARSNNINGSYHNLMNGLCYWRPRSDLTEDDLPDLGNNHTLIPLRNREFQTTCGKLCSKFQWPFGQSGFSAFLTKNEAIVGAPGIFDWKGGVIKLSDNGASVLLPLSRNGQQQINSVNFFRSPPFVLNSTLQPELSASQSSPYFGYSVTSGNYFTTSNVAGSGTQFASGAPRGGPSNNHLAGHVTIFTFPNPNTNTLGPKPLNVLQILDGPKEQIGTYFGSVLCTIDLDGDGDDDLLVGAPFYSRNRQRKATLVTSQEFSNIKSARVRVGETYSGYGDEGAVFVYLSNGNFMEIKKVLHGNDKPWSRFGTAISNLGDINRDGFDDFVVGAPYEDNNKGVIYIYHGFGNGILPNNYRASQIIPASKIDVTLRRFGFSFSNGVDIDKNGYNDLSIGTPSSGQVVILRSSPIVKFTGILNSTISNYPLESKNFNFTFNSCIKYNGIRVPTELKINVKLSSDVDSIIKRILIKDPLSPHISASQHLTYTEVLTFGQTVCREYLGIAIKTLLSSYNAIKIRQEISLSPSNVARSSGTNVKGQKLYNIVSSQRLNREGPSINSFCSKCPIIDEVSSEPVHLALPFTQGCGEDDECITRMRILAKWVELKSNSSFIMGTMDKLTLEIIILNEEELAFQPQAIISWMSRSLLRLPSNCRQNVATNPNEISCNLGIYLKRNENVTLYLEFDMSDLIAGEQGTPDLFIVRINSTTTSQLIEPSIMNLMLPITAQADLSVSCRGSTTFTPDTRNPFNVFQQGYQVLLDGPSTVGQVELMFNIPTKLVAGSGQSLSINITKAEANLDGAIILCLPTGDIAQDIYFDNEQFMGETKTLTSRLRKKRQIPIQKSSTKLKDLINKDHELQLDCSNPSSKLVECELRICQLKKVKPDSIINVDFILRISSGEILSLVEQAKITKVLWEAHGKTIIQTSDPEMSIQPIPNKPDSATCKITISLSDPIPTWIIGSSVAGGLLLLIVIAFCLCACGAFDRKKIEDTDQPTTLSPENIPLNSTAGQNMESEEENDEGVNPAGAYSGSNTFYDRK